VAGRKKPRPPGREPTIQQGISCLSLFESMYDLLAPGICRFCENHVGNLDDAEDIAIEVWIEIWQDMQDPTRFQYKGEGAFRSWAYQKARWRINDFRRRKVALSRRLQVAPFDEEVELEDGSTVNPAENIPSKDFDGDPVRCCEHEEVKANLLRANQQVLNNHEQLELANGLIEDIPPPKGRSVNWIHVNTHRVRTKMRDIWKKIVGSSADEGMVCR